MCRLYALSLTLVLWAGSSAVNAQSQATVAPTLFATSEGSAIAHSAAVSRRPLAPAAVQWVPGGFWGQRLQACQTGTLPTLTQYVDGKERSHFLENFRIAAGLSTGDHRGAGWNDGDTYKWLEALIGVWAQTRESALKSTIDQAVALITQAQREDGYLHTPILIANLQQRQRQLPLTPPFANPAAFEMYNFGHLMLAACAHYEATGEVELLNVAVKAADFLDRWFAEPNHLQARHAICPVHYMGILQLYRTTGQPRYLGLAERWLQMRELVSGSDDNQDRLPLRQQREAVGHAVRANYLFAGATDLLLERDDTDLWTAIESCWLSIQNRKLYITGGCGALYDGASPEGFAKQNEIARVHQAYGRNYQLPNSTAHNETCAAIGYVLWNYRMWQLTGHGKYMDAFEHSLINSVLAGVSLDGRSFFYTNTLRQLNEMPTALRWSRARQPWISCYCCPPNVARTIAALNRYAYSTNQNETYLLLYGANRLKTELPDGQPFAIEQTTNYPSDGQIELRIVDPPAHEYALHLRVPQWCSAWTFSLNGQQISAEVSDGFATLRRRWQRDDRLFIQLEMPVRLLEANPLVEECRGQVAVMRGPLVYCAESIDLPAHTSVLDIAIQPDQIWEVNCSAEQLSGAPVLAGKLLIKGAAELASVDRPGDASLYRDYTAPRWQVVDSQLIPYYAWSNRGASEMSVWLPVTAAKSHTRPLPHP